MRGRWVALLAGLWLVLFFPASASPGEEGVNLDDYKKLERRELIARAAERVRKERPEFAPSYFDRITIEKTPIYVQVTMETPFQFYSLAGREGHDSFQVIVYFLDDATSSLFCTDRVMTGQQMMASEGVVSTLFYRIVNSRELGEKYQPAEFYRPFYPSETADIEPERDFSPYENVNLKLIAVMRDRLRARLMEWEQSRAWGPVMPELIRAYGEAYPEEKREIYRLFLYTTRFATASNFLRQLFGRFNLAGRVGDRKESKAVASRLRTEGKETFEKILAGELPMGGNIGPEIWLLNSQFKIARAVWSGKRDTPLAINLNTAGPVELMTIPGVTPDVARALTDWREENGFFRSLEDIKRVAGVPDSIHQTMALMEKAKASP